MKKFRISFGSMAAITALTFVAGCAEAEKPSANTAPPVTQQSAATSDAPKHAAHGAGPHGGAIADWGGGKYHVEFTVDHNTQESTVYVLGSDEKTAAPIKADKVLLSIVDPKFDVELAPAPLEGETGGVASRFVGTHESLGKVQEFDGTISGEVDGTPYTGDFTEGAEGHGHSHGEDDALVWEVDKDHAGLLIRLGHHGKQLHAGQEIEPAVSITRNKADVSDAKVFNSLVTAGGETVLAKEVPTVYEPPTDAEPAHYAQGALTIPKDATAVAIRFRIVPNGGEEVTFDVPISVE